jgi:ribokinase
VILNAAPAADLPEDAAHFIDVLIVNELEAAFLAGRAGCDGDARDAGRLAQAVAGRWSRCCVLTLGSRGARAVTPACCWIADALPVTPVDTTGAGDTFCGVLAGALDEGQGMDDALRRASVAGALSCLKAGAQAGMPTRQEIGVHLDRLSVRQG